MIWVHQWGYICLIHHLLYKSQFLLSATYDPSLGITTSKIKCSPPFVNNIEMLLGHLVMSLWSQICSAVTLQANSKVRGLSDGQSVGEKSTYRWLWDWETTHEPWLASCSHLAYTHPTLDGALGNVPGRFHFHRHPEEGTINVHQLVRDVYSPVTTWTLK